MKFILPILLAVVLSFGMAAPTEAGNCRNGVCFKARASVARPLIQRRVVRERSVIRGQVFQRGTFWQRGPVRRVLSAPFARF